MKIKINAFSRGKKVYYFDHRHGVLKERVSRYGFMSVLLSTVLIFGGLGFGGVKALDLYRAHKQAVNLQRQSVPVEHAGQASENSDKLKDSSKIAREDKELAKAIKSKLRNVPGGQKWSVYVRDLNSDRMASINADDSRDATGTGNLFLLPSLENRISSDRWKYWFGKLPLNDCVVSFIQAGDEDCGWLVRRYAEQNANSVNEGLGFKKTEVSRKELKSTARETGDLLYRLQNSQVLSDIGRRAVFDGLYGQKSRDGIPGKCTDECLVANVVGEEGNIRNDAAIVTAGDSKYVVVIMTENANWGQIADVANSIRALFQP